MQPGTEPLARELDKEAKGLRQRLGARHLRSALEACSPDPEESAGISSPDETAHTASAAPGQLEELSLLWPSGNEKRTAELYDDSVGDLDVENVAMALTAGAGKEHRRYVTRILCQLCQDPEVIRYRQDVIVDLLHYPELAGGLEELLPQFEELALESMPSGQTTELFQIAWWLGILETYVESVQRVGELFGQVDGPLHSEALTLLRDQIAAIQGEKTFRNLVRELPDLLSSLRGVLSITVGINLTPELQPESATLLSVNDQKFTEAPLLKILLGNTDEYEGVMPLHSVPVLNRPKQGSAPNPMLIPLFRDLAKVMGEVTKPVAKALGQYTRLRYRFLGALRSELGFYVGAANLIRRIEAAGLPMCRPGLADREERVSEVQDSYNLSLALQLLERQGKSDLGGVVIENDVALNSKGRIVVLTGPNQGGKTTYTQGVGLVHVLAQVGLYVPGTGARLSVVDNVFTHFPVEEELSEGTGRFGNEARRLDKIFQRATRYSLVLLNEPLSGTYAGESFYLARDVLRIWRMLGARVILTTHMHELGAQVDDLNEETPGDSPIVSMVSSRIDQELAPGGEASASAIRRTYRVVKSPPMGRSYARELAMLYGISFEQLTELLQGRGLLDPDVDI